LEEISLSLDIKDGLYFPVKLLFSSIVSALQATHTRDLSLRKILIACSI
tara:strand:- start:2036 stop:2182 length:147 start_codon:yes stop_codon:yes gene_type:complete